MGDDDDDDDDDDDSDSGISSTLQGVVADAHKFISWCDQPTCLCRQEAQGK